jgi:poly [ADP-ribose] polymerase 6/8
VRLFIPLRFHFLSLTFICRGMPMLEMVEVDMYIWPTEVLNAGTARAWGVDPTAKIGVRVGFSDSHYTNTHKPPSTLEVFQLVDGKRTKFGLSAQLECCLRNFLREQWDLLKCMNVVALKEKSMFEQSSKGKQPSSPAGPASPTSGSEEIDVGKLQSLVEMGFPQEMALDALLSHGNDLDAATAFLLGDDTVRSKSSAPKHPDTVKPTDATDLIMNPQKALKSGKHGNVTVSGEFGPLVMIAEYVRRRMPQLNNFCVICDKPHVFATGNMLKPAVCSRELCIWSFQQLKVGADSADDIATEAETVDLLICMCAQAAKSTRKELILEPFPTVFHPDQPDIPALSDKSKNFDLVNKILSAMPSVEHMVQAEDFGSLKQRMDSAHALAFPMLQWIISSNRSHIVRLKKEKLVDSMKTPHQYLLLSAPPEREARFRDLKAKHGSVFAFHGSGIENWPSILRRGLFNASGTKLMTAGAAYGAGIYLSPDAAVSFGYSRMGYYAAQPTNAKAVAGSHNRFLSSNNVWCIAVCEVIDHEIRRNNSIWVQPHEDHVVTRFFFVYTETQSAATSCSTSSPEFRKELQSAIDFYSFSKAEAEAAADEPGHKMMT